MSKIIYVTKNGKGVLREGPYTEEEEAEWYGRQTPKAMHHNIQQTKEGGSTSESITVESPQGQAPPFDPDMSHAEWVSRYGTPQNPKEFKPQESPQKPLYDGLHVQVRYDVLKKAFGYDEDQ